MKSILAPTVAVVIGFAIGRVSSSSTTEKESTKSHRGSRLENQGSYKPRSVLRTSGGEPVYFSVFDRLSGGDYESLANSAFHSGNDIDGSIFLEALISAWAQKEPYAALAFAKESNSPSLLFLSLGGLGTVDPDAALSWIKDNVKDVTTHGHLMTAVFQGAAKRDPQGAIQRIGDLSSGPQRDKILSVVVDEWAKNDIDAVFSWLETAEFSQQTPYLYDQVVNRYIISSPAKASALVVDMENGVEKSNFASNVAFQLAELDPKQAVNWVSKLSGEQKEFALSGLLENWAGKQEGGVGALDFLLNNKEESNYEDLFSKVTMQLSQSNPATLEQRLPDFSEKEKELAAVQLAQVYSANVPEKAAQWLDTLEQGPVRDAALTSALNSFRHSNINQAFSLAETFSDEHTRSQEMQKVMTEWMSSNQAAAEQALQDTTAISDSQKEIMLKRLHRTIQPRNEYILPQ